MTTHILHRAEVLRVESGEDGEIEITIRSRDDAERIEKIGITKSDVGLLIESLSLVRDDPRQVVEKLTGVKS